MTTTAVRVRSRDIRAASGEKGSMPDEELDDLRMRSARLDSEAPITDEAIEAHLALLALDPADPADPAAANRLGERSSISTA